MKKLLIGSLLLASLMGCQTTKSTNLTAADLYGKYNLVQFDQVAVSQNEQRPMQLNIAEGKEGNLKINGALCNNFMGQAKLKAGKINATLASTRMACFQENVATMEAAFNTMLSEGATLELNGNTLHIKDTNHSFTYEKQQ